MGLQQRAYAIEAEPDWAQVQAALRASLGVRVRVVREAPAVVSVRAPTVGGGAHVSFAGGRLEWEAPLQANPYFLAHLHVALSAAGARPLPPGTREDAGPIVPWRALPLGRRLAHGLVGQVARGLLWLAMLPLIAAGLLGANLVVLARNAVRRLHGRTPR